LEQFGSIWTEVEFESEPTADTLIAALKQGRGTVRSRPLLWHEMAVITYKVVARGYMPWIDYKKRRGATARAWVE